MGLELASEICIIGVFLELCELRRQRLDISLALVKHFMGLLKHCCKFTCLCFQHGLQALENAWQVQDRFASIGNVLVTALP